MARWVQPDSVWRLIDRGIARGIDPSIDGKDCYSFQRAGGPRPGDLWTLQLIAVERFWGNRDSNT